MELEHTHSNAEHSHGNEECAGQWHIIIESLTLLSHRLDHYYITNHVIDQSQTYLNFAFHGNWAVIA